MKSTFRWYKNRAQASTTRYHAHAYSQKQGVQVFFLIRQPILSPRGGSGHLDDGRSETIVALLSSGMGAATTMVPWVLFVRGGGGVVRGHRGRGWLSGGVFGPDWDKFPDPALWFPVVFLHLNLV